jgi:DNA-directed RNA polymerase subunit D
LKTDKSVTGKSTGKLKIDVKKEGIIYSGDIKGKPEVVYKNMPITILSKNQELRLNATVKPGKGVEHSKFSPGILFYRNINEITLDKEFYEEVREVCSNNEIKEKGNKIVILDNKKKEVADVCEGIANKKNKKAEINKKTGMVLTLESFGQMSAGDIFEKSINSLRKDLAALSKSIGKI